MDVALPERPVVSLTPTIDGHYLNLKIEKIVIDAKSLDYELLYKTKDASLAKDLEGPGAWDPTSFDGDASL